MKAGRETNIVTVRSAAEGVGGDVEPSALVVEADGLGDEAKAYVKICCIRTGTRWYVFEYDKETGRAYCWCKRTDGDGSFGYSAINEVNPGDWEGEDMQSVNNSMRFPPFERESHFSPITIKKIREKFARGQAA